MGSLTPFSRWLNYSHLGTMGLVFFSPRLNDFVVCLSQKAEKCGGCTWESELELDSRPGLAGLDGDFVKLGQGAQGDCGQIAEPL